MRLSLSLALACFWASSHLWIIAPIPGHAFSPRPQTAATHHGSCRTTAMSMTKESNDGTSLLETLYKAMAATLVAGVLWASPAALNTNVNDIFTPSLTMVANAKEMASGSGSRVNKDPESLLRYGLPINSKEVRPLFMLYDIEIGDTPCRLSFAHHSSLLLLFFRFVNCRERLKIFDRKLVRNGNWQHWMEFERLEPC